MTALRSSLPVLLLAAFASMPLVVPYSIARIAAVRNGVQHPALMPAPIPPPAIERELSLILEKLTAIEDRFARMDVETGHSNQAVWRALSDVQQHLANEGMATRIVVNDRADKIQAGFDLLVSRPIPDFEGRIFGFPVILRPRQ